MSIFGSVYEQKMIGQPTFSTQCVAMNLRIHDGKYFSCANASGITFKMAETNRKKQNRIHYDTRRERIVLLE